MYDSAGKYYSSDKLGWYPGQADQAWNNGESESLCSDGLYHPQQEQQPGLVWRCVYTG